MRLADSHCHLDDTQFDADREAVVDRARQAGVEYMLAIGTGNGPPDLEAGLRLAAQHSFVFAAVGVHPNDAPKVDAQTFPDLERLAAHPKVVAIGEIGLDYHWSVSPDVQSPVFVRQMELARRNGLAISIHTRDAWSDTLSLLRTHWPTGSPPCVMHCFTGNPDQARECLDLGFYLAFGGVSTFPKAAEIREAARITPADRLLLETDCPYLAPVPRRGKRNEPAFIAHTAAAIANVRGVPVEELAATTTANFERIFLHNRSFASNGYTEISDV